MKQLSRTAEQSFMKKLKFDIYNHIVPFGCMCSLTLYLRDAGFRSESLFFDWTDSNLKDNIALVRNDFNDFLNESLLTQDYKDQPHIITNTKYNLSYVHVFDRKTTFCRQYKKVKKYLERRIVRFKKALSDKCMLLYYCRKPDEAIWIGNHQQFIEAFCDEFNCDIVFIVNDKIDNLNYLQFVIPSNETHKPFGGKVSFPFEKTDEIDSFLSLHFDCGKRANNLSFKPKKDIFKKAIGRIKNLQRDKLVLER